MGLPYSPSISFYSQVQYKIELMLKAMWRLPKRYKPRRVFQWTLLNTIQSRSFFNRIFGCSKVRPYLLSYLIFVTSFHLACDQQKPNDTRDLLLNNKNKDCDRRVGFEDEILYLYRYHAKISSLRKKTPFRMLIGTVQILNITGA